MFSNKKNRAAILVVVIIILIMSVSGYLISMFKSNTILPESSSPEFNSIPSPIEPEKTNKATIYGVGDNLFHQSVIDYGANKAGYLKYYTNIEQDIKNADIAFVNQETIIGGDNLGVSGYPNFNSPSGVGDALVELGFDVVNHASNHIFDKGIKGVNGTLDFWKKHKDVTVLGIYASQEERDNIAIVEKNGIKFAFLSYTYGLNGYKLPEDKLYTTNLLDLELMLSDVKRASEASDAIVVSLHWGNEYSFVPTAAQRNIAKTLADAGVDLILGHHPHVIQPVEWVEGKDGNKMLVYYSLGNLVHSMEVTDCMLGAAAKVEFERGTDGEVKISKASVEPLINHYVEGKKGFRVYKLSEYTKELADKHGIKAFDRAMSVPNMKEISSKIFGDEWYIDDSWKTILVNPSNSLPQNYKINLELMSDRVPARPDMKVDTRISDVLVKMFDDAKNGGINLYLRSSYRTYALQKTYYDSQYNSYISTGLSPEQARAKTLEYTAYPGTSEHHTGLALDIISVEWENTQKTLMTSFEDTQAFAWLRDNSYKYGIILRYPKGKEAITSINYEPWHFRYVGVEAAKEIYEQEICLEEYLA